MSENFCVENILLGLINTNVSDIFLNSNQPLRVRKSGSIRVVEKYTLSKEDIDNVRKSVVAPALENEYGKDDVEFNICCDVLERVSLFCYYDVTQEFSDFFYSEKAEEIAKEYARLKKQGEDYLEIMGDPKYIPVVKENMKNIVNEFVEEMEEWISNRD